MIILTGIHKRPDTSVNFFRRPHNRNILEKQMLEDGRLLSVQSTNPDEYTEHNTHIFIDRQAYECWINDPSRDDTIAARKIYNEENGIVSKNTVIEC